jgi:CheY-like chemotaxis protein
MQSSAHDFRHLLMAGEDSYQRGQKCLDAGFDDFITKPFQLV